LLTFQECNKKKKREFCYEENSNFTQIALLDIEGKKKLREFDGHRNNGICLCFSPNGEYLLSGSSDGEIIILDIKELKEINRFMVGDNIGINSIQFIHYDVFLTSQFNGSLKTWSLLNMNSSFSVNLQWHISSEIILVNARFEDVKNLK